MDRRRVRAQLRSASRNALTGSTDLPRFRVFPSRRTVDGPSLSGARRAIDGRSLRNEPARANSGSRTNPPSKEAPR